MDYFSVIVLIIVTFIFITDRNIKTIDEIKKEQEDLDIYNEVNGIKKVLTVNKLNTKDMNYNNIVELAKEINSRYILIQNERLDLKNEDIDILVANYINSNKSPAGIKLLYAYEKRKWSLKKIYVDIINYLNIFNKKELSTYGVILCFKDDLKNSEEDFKKQLVSYSAISNTHVILNEKNIQSVNFKKIYVKKISRADLSIILKLFLLIVSSSIITTNLIYSLLNIGQDITRFILSAVIYYCYTYIIKYIYKPIGKQRLIATYVFPVYFLAYIIISIRILWTKVIKKVQAS